MWSPDKDIVFAAPGSSKQKNHTWSRSDGIRFKAGDDVILLASQLQQTRLGQIEARPYSTSAVRSLSGSTTATQETRIEHVLPESFHDVNIYSENCSQVVDALSKPQRQYAACEVKADEASFYSNQFAAWADTDACRPSYFIRPSADQDILRPSAVLPMNIKSKPFFSWRMYEGPSKQLPRKHYCHTRAQFQEYAKLLMDEKILGLDLEWKPENLPLHLRSQYSIKDKVSLIQLASESHIVLFHVARLRGETAAELIVPELRHIIESPDITKVGVWIAGDCTRLREHLHLDPKAYLDLSHVHNLLEATKLGMSRTKKLKRLDHLVEEHLGFSLAKGDVRVSNWAVPLNMEQTDYAANDAYAGLHVFHALNQKRLALDPRPALPPHYLVDKLSTRGTKDKSDKNSGIRIT